MDYQTTLKQLYQDFNARNIDAILPLLHKEVTWPNGWEGGYVKGHDQVRAYWLRQWNEINPSVFPISFELKPGGKIAVDVHQIVKDLHGQVLSDSQITHVYSFGEGKVYQMDIKK